MLTFAKVQTRATLPEMLVNVGASLLKNVDPKNGKEATDGA